MYKQITNSGQNANNLHKILDQSSGCCGAAVDVCQYSVVLPTANAVNNIIIRRNGVDETLTTGFPATGAANVKVAIAAALAAAGFENDNDIVTGVTSETSGTNTIYRITGDVVVVSMKHNGATTVNATALCSRIKKCVYALDWPGSAGTTVVTINGADATLASFTLAGSTAAQVQAALIALTNWPATATVDVVETATAFEIRITDVFTAEYSFAGADPDFTSSNCAMGYVA